MSDSFDVRTSYISLIDHLPSDVIRKLWLLQGLDMSYDALLDELNAGLKVVKDSNLPKDQLRSEFHKIYLKSERLHKIRSESVAEANAIFATIKIAKLKLEYQHDQLERDKSMIENELEMRDNMEKSAQRSNKRTSTFRPKITLKLKLPKLESPEKKATKRRTTDKKLETKLLQEDDEHQDTTLYCTCDRESYGDMVACDNRNCPKEWFHYGCVGLIRAPKGKWVCPLCKKR